MEFNCNYCDKTYKSNSARILHYKQKHNDEYNKYKTNQTINKKEYTCLNCSKILNSRQAKHYHIKKCNVEEKDDILELKNTVSSLIETISLLSNQLNNKLNINNGTINNINNNINNGTINVNFIKFGTEDNIPISKEEFLNIANKKYCAIEQSITNFHLNNNKPELHNIIITDLTDDYAYIFDGNKFIAGFKDEILDRLIDTHVEIIKTNFNEYKKYIPIPVQKKLLDLLSRLEDEDTPFTDNIMSKKKFKNYKDYKKEEAKLIIYNYGNKMTINIQFDSKKDITI